MLQVEYARSAVVLSTSVYVSEDNDLEGFSTSSSIVYEVDAIEHELTGTATISSCQNCTNLFKKRQILRWLERQHVQELRAKLVHMAEVNLNVRLSLAISLQKLSTPWRHKRQKGRRDECLNPLKANGAGAHQI